MPGGEFSSDQTDHLFEYGNTELLVHFVVYVPTTLVVVLQNVPERVVYNVQVLRKSVVNRWDELRCSDHKS